MADAPTSKGPPLFGLPLGGVLLGSFLVACAFAALFACFGLNWYNKASDPAEELATANAALVQPAEAHPTEAHPAGAVGEKP